MRSPAISLQPRPAGARHRRHLVDAGRGKTTLPRAGRPAAKMKSRGGSCWSTRLAPGQCGAGAEGSRRHHRRVSVGTRPWTSASTATRCRAWTTSAPATRPMPEILGSHAMKAAWATFAERYDLVISTARRCWRCRMPGIAQLADYTIFIVHWVRRHATWSRLQSTPCWALPTGHRDQQVNSPSTRSTSTATTATTTALPRLLRCWPHRCAPGANAAGAVAGGADGGGSWPSSGGFPR